MYRDIMRVGAVGGTAAALIGLGTPLSNELPPPSYEAEFCADNPVDPLDIAADSTVLPILQPEHYEAPDENGNMFVGTISIVKGQVEIDPPNILPPAYAKTIGNIAATPYVSCALTQRVKGIDIVVSPDEGAYYSPGFTTSPKTDYIKLQFGTDGSSAAEGQRLLATPGTIAEALNHESAHAFFQKILKDKHQDPELAKLYNKFEASYKQQVTVATEQARPELAKVALPLIAKWQQRFLQHNLANEASAAKRLMEAFSAVGGLNDIAVLRPPFGDPELQLTSIDDMLIALSSGELSKEARPLMYNEAGAEEYDAVNAKYQSLLEQPPQFAGTDESSYRDKDGSKLFFGGQPYRGVNENQASRIGLVTSVPVEELAMYIKNLPPIQRASETEAYNALTGIYKHALAHNPATSKLIDLANRLQY